MNELAWAAGFFDGEGTITRQVRRNRSGERVKRTDLRVSIMQCDPRPLERFAAAVGVGKVFGPYERKRGRQERPFWYWQTNGAAAEGVLDLLWPWLCGPKHEQADRVREEVALSKQGTPA